MEESEERDAASMTFSAKREVRFDAVTRDQSRLIGHEIVKVRRVERLCSLSARVTATRSPLLRACVHAHSLHLNRTFKLMKRAERSAGRSTRDIRRDEKS
jgi:hypothetical protein